MNQRKPNQKFNPESNKNEKLLFADKLKDLLPGVEFQEPVEMLDARTAVVEALASSDQNSDFLRHVWTEYGKVCEQAVDNARQNRAHLQIVALVHKALIFREVGDRQRYGEDLSDAEECAYNMRFDEIAEALGLELDELTR